MLPEKLEQDLAKQAPRAAKSRPGALYKASARSYGGSGSPRRRPRPSLDEVVHARVVADLLARSQQELGRSLSRDEEILLANDGVGGRMPTGNGCDLKGAIAAEKEVVSLGVSIEEHVNLLDEMQHKIDVYVAILKREEGKTEGGSLSCSGLSELRKENQKLEWEMQLAESRLDELGLTWVGGSSSGISGSQEASGGIPGFDPPLTPSDLVRKIASLNECLLSEDSRGRSSARVPITVTVALDEGEKFARLLHLSRVAVVVFGDGMVVAGEYMPYESPRAQAFIRDVVDGYFPTEMENAHPHGVYFTISDESGKFSGQSALQVSKAKSGTAEKISGGVSVARSPYTLAYKKEFLKNVPQTVIRNGRVVTGVRDGLMNLVGEGNDQGARNFSGAKIGNANANKRGDDGIKCTKDCAVVQVRTLSGRTLSILKLNPHMEVQKLREIIDEALGGETEPYDLKLAGAPPVKLVSLAQTLHEAGIHAGSRCTVLMVPA